jgi:dTDP-4-amino-4,6-dideoxygalactose transaminase
MIYLSAPNVSKLEFETVQKALESGWIAPQGPFISQFEEVIKSYLDSNYCLATISGTAALHLALITLGIAENDIVLLPTFTFAATLNAILYQKAIPIFIESESVTWGINPETLRNVILKLPKKPKVIIIVHAYGTPVLLDDIMSIANEFEIPVIEDAAAALGSTYKNKKLGTFGEIGIFSFNGNKIITTSQGGAIVSNNDKLIQKARHLSAQAKIDGNGFEHDSIGYNYRLSNILAALGIAQFESLENKIAIKRSIIERYQANLKFAGIDFLNEPIHCFSNRWLSNVLFENEKIVWRVIEKLNANQIESRRLWKPLHLQTPFKEFKYYGDNFSEKVYKNGLSLPSGTALGLEEVDKISQIVLEEI